MPDYFTLLNEPRRPWLEPEALKEKFLALSASVHPDRVHGLGEAERTAAHERYTALNAAYSCLRNPRDRLRHLLELELGSVPNVTQSIPPGMMDLSLEIGTACREADAVVLEKDKTTSALLKVRLFESSQQLTERLRELRQGIHDRHGALIDELKRSDARWLTTASGSPERAALTEQLQQLYRLFGYFDRWLEQLQERIAQLAF